MDVVFAEMSVGGVISFVVFGIIYLLFIPVMFWLTKWALLVMAILTGDKELMHRDGDVCESIFQPLRHDERTWRNNKWGDHWRDQGRPYSGGE